MGSDVESECVGAAPFEGSGDGEGARRGDWVRGC
jgi:hypothetical protein